MNQEISYLYNNQRHYGKVIDVNEKGNLVVIENQQEVILQSGEVTLGSQNYEKK